MRKIMLYYLRHFPVDHCKQRIVKLLDLTSFGRQVEYTNQQGVTFQLDLEEYQMRQIFLFDYYEKNTVRHLFKVLKRHFRDQITVLDVGTNIGFYTLTIAKALQGRDYNIHCFEPNPVTFSMLKTNIDKNNLPHIHLNPIGLSDRDTTRQLVFHDQNLGTANLYAMPSGQFGHSVNVAVRKLDDYCAEQGIERVQLIKVDIEGAELSFLKGATKTLRKSNKMVLLMEIVEENCIRAGYTGVELFNFVKNAGFSAYLPKGWPFGLKPITELPSHYHDNIIFLKGMQP